jgi:hypothetical protein
MARRKRTHDFPTIIHDALDIHGIVVPSIPFFSFFFLLDLLFYPHFACCRPLSTFDYSVAALRLLSLTYIPIILSARIFHDETVFTTTFLGLANG